MRAIRLLSVLTLTAASFAFSPAGPAAAAPVAAASLAPLAASDGGNLVQQANWHRKPWHQRKVHKKRYHRGSRQ